MSMTNLLCFLSVSAVQSGASKAELMMLTVSDIVKELISAHKSDKDVNLNKYVVINTLNMHL